VAPVELTARRILYEDPDLLIVDKPPGLVAHATVDPKRDHLVAALRRFLSARDGEVGHLAQHHRLDKETSGAVLFCRNPEHDAALGAAFAERRVEKVYWAVVPRREDEPFPPGITELDGYLAPHKGPGGRTLVVRSGGKPARTRVRMLRASDDRLLVEARPLTGRTHQIRVHLADLGFPILGDDLYGGVTPDTKRLLLHALRLEFDHPARDERVRVMAPPPRAFRSRFEGLMALAER